MAENTERRVITTASLKEKENIKVDKGGNILRPVNFDGYIGQNKVKEQVMLAVKSAIIRKRPACHMLFYGPPGLGKTTLAHIVAYEEMVPLKEISGPAIEKPGDIAAILMSLKPKEVLFIDEIHRIPAMCEEVLYSAMEDGYINITVGTGEQQKIVRINVPPFTLIGATTKAGNLSAPLRDRFSLKCRMEYYNASDLCHIVRNSALKEGIQITAEAQKLIASAARGTPRIANTLIERTVDIVTVNKKKIIDTDIVKEAFSLAGVKTSGLTEMDIKLLDILNNAEKPIGLMTLADITGEDTRTIEEMFEPYLLQQGYIIKTSRGREITDKGKNLLKDYGTEKVS